MKTKRKERILNKKEEKRKENRRKRQEKQTRIKNSIVWIRVREREKGKYRASFHYFQIWRKTSTKSLRFLFSSVPGTGGRENRNEEIFLFTQTGTNIVNSQVLIRELNTIIEHKTTRISKKSINRFVRMRERERERRCRAKKSAVIKVQRYCNLERKFPSFISFLHKL